MGHYQVSVQNNVQPSMNQAPQMQQYRPQDMPQTQPPPQNVYVPGAGVMPYQEYGTPSQSSYSQGQQSAYGMPYDDGRPVPAPTYMSSSSEPARIYYKHGVTSLSSSGRQVVDNVAEKYRMAPRMTLRVEGYASVRAQTNDPVKREILNLKTSMDRAITVSQELIKNGVPANSIRTIAYGDTKPAPAQPGVSIEDASRRVEIYGQ